MPSRSRVGKCMIRVSRASCWRRWPRPSSRSHAVASAIRAASRIVHWKLLGCGGMVSPNRPAQPCPREQACASALRLADPRSAPYFRVGLCVPVRPFLPSRGTRRHAAGTHEFSSKGVSREPGSKRGRGVNGSEERLTHRIGRRWPERENQKVFAAVGIGARSSG
jgi:hypothetical protein